jgi:hypothetical protein
MTPTALGVRSSSVPLPTGQQSRIDGYGGDGARAWEPPDYYLTADNAGTVGMAVGPFQSTERFWLCATGGYICAHGGTAWMGHVVKFRLVNLSMLPTADLNGEVQHLAYCSNESSANYPASWLSGMHECKFYCEANQGYYVQLLSAGGGSQSSYYSGNPTQLSLAAYTIGEGVY